MDFSFFPYKMDIHNCLDKTSQLDQEHKNGNLSLSRIHIGLNHTRDRIINYIYLKDNKFYSLVKNILKCPEWSHTQIPRENTMKHWNGHQDALQVFSFSNTDQIANAYTHTLTDANGKVSL